MNKQEMTFCSRLSGYLRKTQPEYSMAIEVKVCDKRFNLSELRKGQLATLRKLHRGIPVVHKISDGAVGSKLVDLIYLHPGSLNTCPMVAINFIGERKAYLLPFYIIDGFMNRNFKSITVDDLKGDTYKIKWN